MAYMSTSLGNAILMALFSISYVAEITATVGSYAELAAHSLANVAEMRRLDLEIRSSCPKWYGAGMQISAFRLGPVNWKKRHLTWALVNHPVNVSEKIVSAAVEAACAKWAKVSPFTFERVHYPSRKPDIRVETVPQGNSYPMYSICDGYEDIDHEGASLMYYDMADWAKLDNWPHFFRFKVLYHMGVILGLDNSEVPGAFMYRYENVRHPGTLTPYDYALTKDDIAGIQAKYGPPTKKDSTEESSTSDSSETSSSSSSSDSSGASSPPNSSRPPISAHPSSPSSVGRNPYPRGTEENRRWGDGYLRSFGESPLSERFVHGRNPYPRGTEENRRWGDARLRNLF